MRERFFSLFALACAALALSATIGCSHKPARVVEEKANYFGTAQVHRYQLPNGLKILVLEDHSSPTFAFHVWYKVGSKDEQTGLTGLAHFFEHMMFKQTKNLKDGEFDRTLEAAGVEGENAFTTRDNTTYIQSLPSDKLDLIARLEAERMVNLVIGEEGLNSERQVVHNERRFRYDNSPMGQLYERIYELAYDKHAYHWPVIGYAKDLDNAKREDFENFYKRFYAPNNATVVVVGDVKPDQALRTVQKHFGALSPSKIDRPQSPIEPLQAQERVEIKPVKSEVELMIVGYHIPNLNHADFPAIEVTRNILAGGKGSRLYKRLVDGGIATRVDVESAEHSDPGLLLFFVGLQKQKAGGESQARKALAAIDAEIQALALGKITPEEIQRAVSMHRFQLFDGLASNHSKAQFLGFYETIAGRFERGIELVNALTSVNKRNVARIAKTYLEKTNRSVVIGTPMKKEAK